MSWRARRRIGSLAAAALLAAGCDSGGGPAGSDEADSFADAAAINASLSPDEAALRARAVAALAAVLPSAVAAAYANVRSGPGQSICGAVDAGDGLGPRLFLVTAEGRAIVSTGPELRLEDPNDPFPDLYMQYCATAEELRRIGERMQSLRPLDVPAAPPLVGGEIPMPADDADAGDEAQPGSQPPEEGRRQADDSFFNSVLRTPRQSAPPG